MLKNILYAILLGTGMAACLSQQEDTPLGNAQNAGTATPQAEAAADLPTATIPDPASFIVQKGQVGQVKIGMPIEEMRQHIPAGFAITDTTLEQEGQTAAAYLLFPQGKDSGLLIEQLCASACRVWRISIQDPAFKTPQGIGIGSTYGQAQQAHPVSSLTYEEGNLVAVAKTAGLSFILDTSQLPAERLAQLTPSTVPANTVVKRMLVY